MLTFVVGGATPRFRATLSVLVAVAAIGCSGPRSRDDAADAHGEVVHGDSQSALPADAYIPPRTGGDRTPRSAPCDSVDPVHCLLPWPSNTFTAADRSTPTGLRLNLARSALGAGDDPSSVNRADGFSRVTPLLTAFRATIDAASLGDGTTGALRVLVAQPGGAFGAPVPLRLRVQPAGTFPAATLLLAYPRSPMAPATDHVVVVTDQLRSSDGMPIAATREARVSLGLDPPATWDELALAAYHAPTREVIARAGLEPSRILRVWDFTTRSLDAPTLAITAMRTTAVAAASTARVQIDRTEFPAAGASSVIVEGRLVGVPTFRNSTGSLDRDAQFRPVALSSHDVLFRAAIPRGGGDYPVAVYGHGSGGDVHDSAFDDAIANTGAMKLNIQYAGFTGPEVANTYASFRSMLIGTDIAAAGLLQSIADGMTLLASLSGALGDALSAPALGGLPNPAAGRRADLSRVAYAGGSLGGTAGMVFTYAEPRVTAAVLNVPGAGLTHFLPFGPTFAIVRLATRAVYATDLDLSVALATSQINWDDVDGSTWVDAVGAHSPAILVQESIGDPILANVGSELVATSAHCSFVGGVIVDVPSLPRRSEVVSGCGFTQFRVPAAVTDSLAIHGFAARDSPAGVAAREQISAFLLAAWARAPSVTVPPTCARNTPANSCDFRDR